MTHRPAIQLTALGAALILFLIGCGGPSQGPDRPAPAGSQGGHIATLPKLDQKPPFPIPSTSVAPYAVAFGTDKFVSLASNGKTVYTSTDGENWTGAPTGLTFDKSPWIGSMAYGNHRFIAAGSGLLLASTDGVTWRRINQECACNGDAVRFMNGHFYLTASEATIYRSEDGVKWTALSVGVIEKGQVTAGVAEHNGNLIVITGDYFYNSRDGAKTWAKTGSVAQLGSGDPMAGITYGKNGFVAANFVGFIGKSDDGLQWKQIVRSHMEVDSVAYEGGIYFVLGHLSEPRLNLNYASFLFSADGINWTSVDPDEKGVTGGAAYGNNRWVVIGANFDVAVSLDGKAWRKAWIKPL